MSESDEPGPVARQLAHTAQELEMAAGFAQAGGGEHSAAFAALAMTAVRAWIAELERSRAERVHISQVYTGLDTLTELVALVASAPAGIDLGPDARNPTPAEQQEWEAIEQAVFDFYEELETLRERAEEVAEALRSREP
ncbi:hypothetical protein [Nocardiopsis changdeensis]|uniref:hypothetical protein n=1 Tax=Nocardiopsis changdeensis TaxID=2831969 RepID=UPI003F46896B